MNSVIKLNSRGEDNNYLEQLFTTNTNNSKSYLLKTKLSYRIIGNNFDKPDAIDPAGGPMIRVGTILDEAQMKVKHIDIVKDLGAIITLE